MQEGAIVVKTYAPSKFNFAITDDPSRDSLFKTLKSATNMQKMGMVVMKTGVQKIDELLDSMIQTSNFLGYSYLRDAQKVGLACVVLGNRRKDEGVNFIEIKHIIGNVEFKCSVGHMGHLMLQYIIKESLYNEEKNYQCVTLAATAATIAYFSHVFNFMDTVKPTYDWIMDESHQNPHESEYRVPSANIDNLRWEYNFVWGTPTRSQVFAIGMNNTYPLYSDIVTHSDHINSFVTISKMIDNAVDDSKYLIAKTSKAERDAIEEAFHGLLVKKMVSDSRGMFDNKDDAEDITEIQCEEGSEIYEVPCVFTNTLIGTTQFIPKIWYDPIFFLNFNVVRECHRVIYDRAHTTIHILRERNKFLRSGIAGESVIGMYSDVQKTSHNVVIHNASFENTHLAVKVLAFFLGIICCQIPKKPLVVALPRQFKRGRVGNAVDFPVEVANALKEMGIDQDKFNELRHIDYHFGDPIESYDDDVKKIATIFEQIIKTIAASRTTPRSKFENLIAAIQGICGYTFSDLTIFTARAYPPT